MPTFNAPSKYFLLAALILATNIFNIALFTRIAGILTLQDRPVLLALVGAGHILSLGLLSLFTGHLIRQGMDLADRRDDEARSRAK